jgi:hypothetical protein
VSVVVQIGAAESCCADGNLEICRAWREERAVFLGDVSLVYGRNNRNIQFEGLSRRVRQKLGLCALLMRRRVFVPSSSFGQYTESGFEEELASQAQIMIKKYDEGLDLEIQKQRSKSSRTKSPPNPSTPPSRHPPSPTVLSRHLSAERDKLLVSGFEP